MWNKSRDNDWEIEASVFNTAWQFNQHDVNIQKNYISYTHDNLICALFATNLISIDKLRV